MEHNDADCRGNNSDGKCLAKSEIEFFAPGREAKNSPCTLILFICLATWLSQNLLLIGTSISFTPFFYLSCLNVVIISLFVFLFIRNTKTQLKDKRTVCLGSVHRKYIENNAEAFIILHVEKDESEQNSFIIYEANKSASLFINIKHSEIIGKNIFDVLPSGAAIWIAAEIEKAIRLKGLHEIEVQGCPNEKCNSWFRYSILPFDGEIAVSVRDISDRKRAEATLRESESMFRALAETSASMIFIMNTEGRFLYTNPSFQLITGYSELELSRMTFSDIINPDQNNGASPAPMLNYEDRGAFREIIGIATRSNTEKWVDISVTKVNFNATPAFIGSALDITERKRAEEEIAESEVRFRTIFDFFPYAISLSDIETGKFISVNNQFCKLTKYRPEDVVGRSSSELGIYPGDFRKQYLLSRLKETGRVDNLEIDFQASDSTIFNGSLFSKVVKIKNSDMLISVIKDITDLKTLQRQLQQTQKMEAIGTLAGGIAHDFNNILVPIIAYAEMLMSDSISDKQEEYLNNIVQAATRAKGLVQQILSFSRQNEMVLEPVLIQPIAREAIRFLRASLPSTIEIKADIDKKCGPIIGNTSQIHQLIMNLSTNAKHAMENTGGVLEISLKEADVWPNDFNEFSDIYPGRYAKITVSDTGHGIENSVLDKIFEPYFTTKKDGKGTGMGLSVVHGIVKAYGGSITVMSRPGKGTAFDIYLPLVHKPVKECGCADVCAVPSGKEHILVVDDEPLIVAAEKEILEGFGYRISSSTNSLEAYELFLERLNEIDLVVTDMTMPRMTGAELAIRILEKKPDMPIILCTGYCENFSEANAEAIGVKKYIVKPFTAHKLASSIREVLDKASLGDGCEYGLSEHVVAS